MGYQPPPWSDGTYFDDGTGWQEDVEVDMSADAIRRKLLEAIAEARTEAEAGKAEMQGLIDEIDRLAAALSQDSDGETSSAASGGSADG